MQREPDKNAAPVKDSNQGATFLPWWKNWKFMVPTWGLIGVLIWLGKRYQVDTQIIASGVFLIGLLSNAFTWMLGIIAAVPLIGPLIVKILSLGFIWLLNAVVYMVSFVAIRRGYSKDVLTYRGVTVALIVGIVIGFVLGKAL